MDKRRDWIILQRPGMVPERKGPLTDYRQVADMLRALYGQHPGANCIMLDMTVSSDPWPQDGREWLAMFDSPKSWRRQRLGSLNKESNQS